MFAWLAGRKRKIKCAQSDVSFVDLVRGGLTCVDEQVIGSILARHVSFEARAIRVKRLRRVLLGALQRFSQELFVLTFPSSSKTTVETLDDVLQRVAVLERTVSKLSKFSAASEASTIRVPSRASRLPTALLSTESQASTIRSAYGRTSTDEDVAMMLEVRFTPGTCLVEIEHRL